MPERGVSGIKLGRFVEHALSVTDSAENFVVANRLAAQALGDRLQKDVAIADMQRARGAEELIQLILGEMQN
jgi:hypothetical protein